MFKPKKKKWKNEGEPSRTRKNRGEPRGTREEEEPGKARENQGEPDLFVVNKHRISRRHFERVKSERAQESQICFKFV